MADEKNLKNEFNDPANKKFQKIWMKEADIADDFELGCEWYTKWSKDRDNYAAQKDTQREKFCADLVDFWDRYLVKAAGRLAKHKSHIDMGKDEVVAEFSKENLTLLAPVYDALSKLDDTQIKSGKAIYDALMPLMTVQQPEPQAKKPGPLDGGNPFKKGPSV